MESTFERNPDHPDIVSAKGSRENPSLSLETE